MTDHKSLQHFKTQPMLSGRQSRWKDIIADYDFDIEYVKGDTNVVVGGSCPVRARVSPAIAAESRSLARSERKSAPTHIVLIVSATVWRTRRQFSSVTYPDHHCCARVPG